jgi:hypothetical protein
MFIRKKRTPSDTVALFDQLARRQEPRISRAFMAGLENVRDRVNATRLEQLLSSGDTNAILQLLSLDQSREDLQQFKAAINQAVSEGAKAAAESQPSVTGLNGTQVNFVFDSQNPRLAQYAQQISSTRIREISEDVRQVARNVISQDTTAGINPRETARRLRDSIGLTAKQEAAVQNYRRSLEQLDGDALRRELRDKRSDSKVRSAIENAKPLPNDRINSLVERYRKKYVKYRAETIARTEATRSLAGAQWELFQSYIDEGRIDERQVRRFWKPTLDGRTRNEHMLIPDMNPGGVGQNEPFESMFGPIMYPGDPNARADNTINCRCAVFPRIIGLELIQNPDFDVDRYLGGPARSQPPAPPEQQQLDLPPTPQPVQTVASLFADKSLSERLWNTAAFADAEIGRLAGARKAAGLKAVNTPNSADAFYQPARTEITMGRRIGSPDTIGGTGVYRHEFGHYIDDQIHWTRTERGDPARAQQYASFDAVDDLAADGKALIATRTGDRDSPKNERRAIDNAIALSNELGSDRAKLQAAYAQDGLDLDEMVRVFPKVREIENGEARLLSAWRDRDHRRIMEVFTDWSVGHGGKMNGLSDTIEASVNAKFSYYFGHGKAYYLKRNKFYGRYGFTKTLNRQKYNPGHTTQAFANWFEAYTSGDETQLQIFKHFLPRTAAKFEKIYKDFSDG